MSPLSEEVPDDLAAEEAEPVVESDDAAREGWGEDEPSAQGEAEDEELSPEEARRKSERYELEAFFESESDDFAEEEPEGDDLAAEQGSEGDGLAGQEEAAPGSEASLRFALLPALVGVALVAFVLGAVFLTLRDPIDLSEHPGDVGAVSSESGSPGTAKAFKIVLDVEDNWVTGEATVDIKGSISAPQQASAEARGVSVSLASDGSFVLPGIPLKEGVNNVRVKVRSLSGIRRVRTRSTRIVSDRKAPFLEVRTPGKSTVTGSDAVVVEGRVEDLTLDTVTINGAVVDAAGGWFKRTVPLPTFGEHVITVVAGDRVGLTTEVVRTVTRKEGAAVAEKPVAKTPVAKTPVAKKPVAKKPVAKKPVAKKPVDPAPVAKKPTEPAPVARSEGPPKWYAALSVRERPELPLPEGIEFAKEPRHYVGSKDGSVLVWVRSGSFPMGSEQGYADERPVHQVSITRGYFMGKFEVTWKQLRAWWKSTEVLSRALPEGVSEDHPATEVTWSEARDYCAWAGLRLPSEAEWEFAARGDGTVFPWGSDSPLDPKVPRCNLRGSADGHEGLALPGAFPAGASPFGCMDMAGNVWEWVADRYGRYPSDPQKDPQGAAYGPWRVFRGGAWDSVARDVRSTHRRKLEPQTRYYSLGFRVAASSD